MTEVEFLLLVGKLGTGNGRRQIGLGLTTETKSTLYFTGNKSF